MYAAFGGNVNSRIEIGSIVENDYQPAVRGGIREVLKRGDKQLSTLAKKVVDLETKLIEYQLAMASDIYCGGLGVVVVGPSASAGSAAMKQADFMNTTTDAIVDEYNRS